VVADELVGAFGRPTRAGAAFGWTAALIDKLEDT